MPQLQLPMFPAGVTEINSQIAVQKEAGRVFYLHGHLPVFQHEEQDVRSFRMFTSQMIARRDGETQRDRQDVWRADGHGEAVCEGVSGPRLQGVLRIPATPQFGVSAERTSAGTGATVARWGAERAGSGGGTERAAEHFAQGDPRGPFTRSSKKSDRDATEVTNQSERSQTDSQAPMGNGATRTLERVAAAMGDLESAPIEFHPTCDVAQGGVLLALPALLAAGLLRRTPEFYQLPQGFYGMESIFLLLGLMALARIRSLEQLRYQAPGEWGKLLGLDRIPEVRTLRAKLKVLCQDMGRAMEWNAALAQEWIARQNATDLISTATATCACITETRPRCRATMWPASGCVCGPRPITGSAPWTASPSYT